MVNNLMPSDLVKIKSLRNLLIDCPITLQNDNEEELYLMSRLPVDKICITTIPCTYLDVNQIVKNVALM